MTALHSGLRHPGPPAYERRQVAATRLQPLEGNLAAGGVLMEEVTRLFDEAGCKGGLLWFDGMTADPFRYVLPALSTDGVHAAYYSETHAPSGLVTLGSAVAIVGWRDGVRFLHCHGEWRMEDGTTAMGHLLPLESRVAKLATVRGLGASEAWFEALPDEETNFTLFSAAGGGNGRSLLLRLRPGEDVVTAIEQVAARHELKHGRVHGIGSICDPVFTNGKQVQCVATEVRIDAGEIADGTCTITASLVDVEGRVHSGTLTKGENFVGVTFEIIIENLEGQ